MKKIFFFLSAIALMGLTAACVEQSEVNPNFDPIANSVKTAFTINVATEVQTKASANTVQDKKPFRGMDDMKLFVVADNPAAASAEFIKGYRYNLGTLAANEISATQSSKMYDITIPTGVNNMVFYAKATDNTEPREGKIYYSVGEKKDETHFDIWPVLGTQYVEGEGVNVDTDDFVESAEAIAGILTTIFGVDGWSEFDEQLSPLANAYYEVTRLGVTDPFNGSGEAVLGILQDIYDICDNILNPNMLEPSKEATALAGDIAAAIEAYFNVSEGKLSFKDSDLADFPCNLGLPSGCAQVFFDPQNEQFFYAGFDQGSPVIGDLGTMPDKIAYPAELCYWVSSPLRVNENEVAKTDFPTTVLTWAQDNWGNGWVKDGTVQASTHSVALQNNIQYGTALLKTSVQFDATTLKDNRKAIMEERDVEEEDMEITLGVDGNFTLKGILVGGQPNQVSWNWAPMGQTDFSYVVYDNYLEDGNPVDLPTDTKTLKGPYYTMVFDNLAFGKETADQSKVYVALELVNNTKDFWGKDNMIREGATFYLVAELDVNAADLSKFNYPANGLRFPPFACDYADNATSGAAGTDYSNHEVIRAFMQDFATEAIITIGVDALKEAHSTVPNLREVEMSFGLSVDLDWSAGPVYDLKLGVPTNTGADGNGN